MRDLVSLDVPSTAPRVCGCYLGSFDPPHRGHVALVHELVREADEVLLLVPTRHFHKNPSYPANATFDQRLEMLRAVFAGQPVHVGLTGTVLFLELDTALQQRLPASSILFAMGDDTFRRLSESPAYYARCGKPWGDGERRRLADLRRRCRVWNRSGRLPSARPVEARWSDVSSSHVREQAAQLWRRGAGAAEWHSRLDSTVSPVVVDLILRDRLYRCTMSSPIRTHP